MWRDSNVEMWLELVGVDRRDQPKLREAAGLRATLTRFSGKNFSSEFCQHLIDMMGGGIDIPQLGTLCSFISTKLQIFNSLTLSNKDNSEPEKLTMSEILVALECQGYYAGKETECTGIERNTPLLESALSTLMSSISILDSTFSDDRGFTLEDFILICILVDFTAVPKAENNDEYGNHASASRIRQMFPDIEQWVQSVTKNSNIKMEFLIKKHKRVAVVTGGNRGLGLGIVRKLCQEFDGDVYLTCRDANRGEEALEILKNEGLSPKFHILDLISPESITAFRAHLEMVYGGLDILINNAATAFLHTGSLAEDIQTAEATINCNYFGTLELCKALFPLLRSYSRIVTIVSSCGVFAVTGHEAKSVLLRKQLGNPNLTMLELNKIMESYLSSVRSNSIHDDGWQDIVVSSNNISKIGLQALTSIQQKELDRSRPNEGIAINSFHPGLIKTEKAAAFKGPMLSVDQGAVGPFRAATLSPNQNIPKGQFLWTDLQAVNWVDGPIPWCY